MRVGGWSADECRFWSKADIGDGCWTWRAAMFKNGYGRFRPNGKDGINALAHRYAYTLLRGRIKSGLVLDHLCRNRACVRPSHLDPVTNGENVRRGRAGEKIAAFEWAKTHCPSLHQYDEANTRIYRGRRVCRSCCRIKQAARRATR